MDARKANIYKFLSGDKQYIIPVYQRIYSWEIEECKRLWFDIVDMQKKNKNGHFVGSIVSITENDSPSDMSKFTIIDGQQRITTLMLLLLALRDYAFIHREEKSINWKKINNSFLKNPDEDDDSQYKLLLTETDKDILISLIEKRPIDENLNSRLISNYNYFFSNIKNMDLSLQDIYEAIGKLQIVNINLDRTSDEPQVIFESLNSTGKELSESDLIRNFVLMGLDNKQQKDIYKNIWRPMEQLFRYEKQTLLMDRFFRDYLTMKLARIPKLDKIYEEFKMYTNNCEFSTLEDLCKDLYMYARYYTNMIFEQGANKNLINLYKEIKYLKMEVAFPFLLKIHYDFERNLINEDELVSIIKLCISYVFRRNICDIPTNSLNKTFATLKNEINVDDYINSIKAFFILKDDYKIFPNDEKFSSALKVKDIYHMRIRNYILSSLENFNNKAPINIENYTIEHIMPQTKNLSNVWKKELGKNYETVQKKYLHTIGNLTLTAYNSEMSNKSFSEKMEMNGGFKESALRLNSYVIKQNEWNEKIIKERASILVEKALLIWKYPIIERNILVKYKNDDKQQMYGIDSYDFNKTTKMLFDKLNMRIMNLSSEVRREFKKLYIAYKLDTNFADIVVQKNRLRISVNMKFNEVIDEYNICKDVTNLGRWGNGDVELFLEDICDVDKVMDIIRQSFNKQL
ncbi:GmrSD restriction endonuclease domain-containing protein [Megamonas funiformis]|uniref:GmrSD restriction endonuclease domain-containing protein n=1 Tax=Megamonas funiformis TaxID=437897 RepID=UPI003F9E493C